MRAGVALATAITFLAAVTLATGCGERMSPPPLTLATTPAGRNTRVTLIAAPDLKVNARLKPALELHDGTVLRFSADRLTSDSAYFAEPPSALLVGRYARVHGTLHASVCGVDEQVCRSVTVRLD